MDALAVLTDVLPAGEWASITLVTRGGMMQSRSWAILAKAQWLRGGGVSAFIKLTLSAGSSAGSDTFAATSPERLRQVEKRLNSVRNNPGIPVVRVVEMRNIPNVGLLVAMEDITTVQDLIDAGKADVATATRVLVDLGGDVDDLAAWHHFDVCPKNIGIDRAGRAVLIDLESVYLAEEDAFRVSYPAFKERRLPRVLAGEVLAGLRAGVLALDVPVPVARRKFQYELVLAAAECVLGAMPAIGDSLDWLRSRSDDPRGALLLDAAERLIRGEVIDLAVLAAALEREVPMDVKEEPTPRPAAASSPAIAVQQSAYPISSLDAVDAVGRELRRGNLGQEEIESYRQQLEEWVALEPNALAAWRELLFVVLSYKRDQKAALSVAERAMAANQDAQEFVRWRQILSMWRPE